LAILLGVTWSPVAAALPDLTRLVDLVEVAGWQVPPPGERPRRHLVVHTLDLDTSLAQPGLIDDAWGERARAVLANTRTPWFSLHLGFASERVRFEGHMLPESVPLDRDTLFERIVANVRRAKERVPIPLLLENLDYCPEGAYEHVCDPVFIRAVLEATDTGLLLDLAHLQVSASWFGIAPEAMLDALPLERVVEVHVSGPRPVVGNDARLDDVHETLTERDVELLRGVLQRATPRAVVLEYRREALALRGQLARLGSVVGRVRRPSC
jgi:uncharacterized protein (UPF0276 family)